MIVINVLNYIGDGAAKNCAVVTEKNFEHLRDILFPRTQGGYFSG